MVAVQRFDGEFPAPIETLERHFRDGGTSLLRAMFESTFFVAPDVVRARTPYFPGFARMSREHYPQLTRGADAFWQGDAVKLGDNARAQLAWARYTGRPVLRRSGYGVRHVWGNPWNPAAFTAGWNLAYMPFWAGMLTEDQHPHPLVQAAVKQAAWNLFFDRDPVCETPTFVDNPGLDLDELLDGQPLLVAVPPPTQTSLPVTRTAAAGLDAEDPAEIVKDIRSRRNNSWSNLRKAARQLQGLDHEPFSTVNVENNSKSHVRLMMRETGLSIDAVADLIETLATPPTA